jgi:hypothetical protein
MSVIARNLQVVHARIAAAAMVASRDPRGTSLPAVSKTFGADAIRAAAQAGHRAFGENFQHEALDNMATVRAVQQQELLKWHFIGPMQGNKTWPIAQHVDCVHSIRFRWACRPILMLQSSTGRR